jgi:hypothetical protein
VPPAPQMVALPEPKAARKKAAPKLVTPPKSRRGA